MKDYKVIFTDCNSRDTLPKTWTRVSFDSAEDRCEYRRDWIISMIKEAVTHKYGMSYWWLVDSGLGLRYGTLCRAIRPTKRNSNPGSSVDGRYAVRIIDMKTKEEIL